MRHIKLFEQQTNERPNFFPEMQSLKGKIIISLQAIITDLCKKYDLISIPVESDFSYEESSYNIKRVDDSTIYAIQNGNIEEEEWDLNTPHIEELSNLYITLIHAEKTPISFLYWTLEQDDLTTFKKLIKYRDIDLIPKEGDRWSIFDDWRHKNRKQILKYMKGYEFQKLFVSRYPEKTTMLKKIGVDQKIQEEFSDIFEGEAMGFFSIKN